MPTQYTWTGQYAYTDDLSTQGVTEGFGLVYFNARWVDPTIGRFAQPDSIVPTGSQGTQAWDRYAFVNNNPVRYNDPTGHCIDCVIVVLVVFAAWISIQPLLEMAKGHEYPGKNTPLFRPPALPNLPPLLGPELIPPTIILISLFIASHFISKETDGGPMNLCYDTLNNCPSTPTATPEAISIPAATSTPALTSTSTPTPTSATTPTSVPSYTPMPAPETYYRME